MRFVARYTAVTAISLAAILTGSQSLLGQTSQICPDNPRTCDQLSACAPFKDRSDPNYVKWINCVSYGNPNVPSNKSQNADRGGLPFQSPLLTPSR